MNYSRLRHRWFVWRNFRRHGLPGYGQVMWAATIAVLALLALALLAGCKPGSTPSPAHSSMAAQASGVTSSFLASPAGKAAVLKAQVCIGDQPFIPGTEKNIGTPITRAYLAQHPVKGTRKWVRCMVPTGSTRAVYLCFIKGFHVGSGALAADEQTLAACATGAPE